jgi:hypothetical protein
MITSIKYEEFITEIKTEEHRNGQIVKNVSKYFMVVLRSKEWR